MQVQGSAPLSLSDRNIQRAPEDHILPPWRFWALVDLAGKRADLVAAIDAIADPAKRAVARARADHADEYDRADPLVVELAEAVGLSGDDLAALWAQAAQL